MYLYRSLKYCLIFLAITYSACGRGPEHAGEQAVKKLPEKVSGKIALLAFEGTDPALVQQMEQALLKEWTPEVELIRAGAEPAEAWFAARKRWIADSILVWLDRQNGGRYLKMAGISCHDISTRKDGHENWGVLGLGNCPGRSCVVSSFRAKRGGTDFRKLSLRMRSLLFHELGHTFGLPHCPTAGCIMEDAQGKMTLDGEKGFCTACRKRLMDIGLLRNR